MTGLEIEASAVWLVRTLLGERVDIGEQDRDRAAAGDQVDNDRA
jgi:hypothetical protein